MHNLKRLDLTELYFYLQTQSILQGQHRLKLNPGFEQQSAQPYSRQQVADQMKINRTTLGRWIAKPENPKLGDINKLARATDVYSPLDLLSIDFLDDGTEMRLTQVVAQILSGLIVKYNRGSGTEEVNISQLEEYLSQHSVLSQPNQHEIILTSDFQLPVQDSNQKMELNTIEKMAQQMGRDKTTIGRWKQNPQQPKLADVNGLSQAIGVYSPLVFLSVKWLDDGRQMSLLELLEEIYRGFSPSQTKVDNSGVEQRLEQIEVHLKKIDQHLDQIDQRLTEKGNDSLLEVEDLVNQFRQLTDKNKARFLKSISDNNV